MDNKLLNETVKNLFNEKELPFEVNYKTNDSERQTPVFKAGVIVTDESETEIAEKLVDQMATLLVSKCSPMDENFYSYITIEYLVAPFITHSPEAIGEHLAAYVSQNNLGQKIAWLVMRGNFDVTNMFKDQEFISINTEPVDIIRP